jgi:hypothetical protein
MPQSRCGLCGEDKNLHCGEYNPGLPARIPSLYRDIPAHNDDDDDNNNNNNTCAIFLILHSPAK